ncbi:MAG: 2-amino-4-hydroxy-6-hydroxymethyldihydropteridine diphosphokinase [Planctomycetota bacterium]
MAVCLVALGSNEGDRASALDRAFRSLDELSTMPACESKRLVTPSVGGPEGQAEYLNSVVAIRTDKSPRDLFGELRSIERAAGNRSAIRWSARPLDVDLLAYADEVIDEPGLRVPHPRMSFRPFVVAPAAELAGDWVHPELGVSLHALAALVAAPPPTVVVVGRGEVADRCVEEVRNAASLPPGVAVRRSAEVDGLQPADAGLTIDASEAGFAARGPRLRVADCDAGRLSSEVAAALGCLWPRTLSPEAPAP